MRPSRVVLLVALSTSLVATDLLAEMRFVDATQDSGIRFQPVCGAAPRDKEWLTEAMGGGAAWLDYDGDGKLDLYLVNGSTHDRPAGKGEPNRLYRGDGKGRFTDVTEAVGVGDRGWGQGVTVGDYDNDGDPDLFLANMGPNVLYRNDGDGTFTDVTKRAGVGPSPWSSSAAFVDIDGDGDLDLYVGNYMESDVSKIPRRTDEAAVQGSCNYQGIQVFCGPRGRRPEQDQLFRNDGDGTFTEITRAAGIELDTPRFALGVVSGDYDNDGDPDLYVANDSVTNSLWRNNGDGTFTDVGVSSLSGLNADGRAQAGMGTDFGDYNGDGWLDIVVTNFAHDLNTLYRNLSGRFFVDESSLVGMGVTNLALSWGTAFHDFDHDGDLDLFIANGHVYPQVDDFDLATRYRQTNHLFENEGGKFKGVSGGPGLSVARSFRGAAFADYDDDGDIDVLVTALDQPPVLLRNDSPDVGNRLQLALTGTRSNRDGIGARITVATTSGSVIRERKGGGSYLSASDPRIHVGLGAATRAERIEVRWPSGTIDVLTEVPANRVIGVREGSSPAKK